MGGSVFCDTLFSPNSCAPIHDTLRMSSGFSSTLGEHPLRCRWPFADYPRSPGAQLVAVFSSFPHFLVDLVD